MMEPKIGLTEQQRKPVADGLGKMLADTYTLYLKTHNYHWNVEGPMFSTLHALFEEQYQNLAVAVDDIAERIRILGFRAPGSFKDYLELSSVSDSEKTDLPAREMISELLKANEIVVATTKAVLVKAQEVEDEGTVGLLGDRINYHEKTAWMLRSLLAG